MRGLCASVLWCWHGCTQCNERARSTEDLCPKGARCEILIHYWRIILQGLCVSVLWCWHSCTLCNELSHSTEDLIILRVTIEVFITKYYWLVQNIERLPVIVKSSSFVITSTYWAIAKFLLTNAVCNIRCVCMQLFSFCLSYRLGLEKWKRLPVGTPGFLLVLF